MDLRPEMIVALRTAADTALARCWPPRRRLLAELERQRLGDEAWDREHGVDTGVPSGVAPDHFHDAMRSLAVPFETFTFVDFSSSKGKALLLASEFPFREIVAIQETRPMHEAVIENIRRYRGGSPHCTRMRSVCCDPRRFQLPLTPVVCFFSFNPVAPPPLRRVLARIHGSVRLRPRPAYVVCAYPRKAFAIMTPGQALRQP